MEVKVTSEMAKAIEEANSITEISELCKRAQEQQGLLAANKNRDLVPTTIAAAPAPPAELPLIRQRVRCPDGSVQVIEAYSETGLDILRAAALRDRPAKSFFNR
jgi:hypothetical protein